MGGCYEFKASLYSYDSNLDMSALLLCSVKNSILGTDHELYECVVVYDYSTT